MGLKKATFRVNPESIGWVTKALQTITPEHRDLQGISIRIHRGLVLGGVGPDTVQSLGEAISRRWLDLDRLLVKFWEFRSIRPGVGCRGLGDKQRDMDYCIGYLLPEITKRGLVDPV